MVRKRNSKPRSPWSVINSTAGKFNHSISSCKPGRITRRKVNNSSRNAASGYSFYYPCFWAPLPSLLSMPAFLASLVSSVRSPLSPTSPVPRGFCVLLLLSSKGACCSSSEQGESLPASCSSSITAGDPAAQQEWLHNTPSHVTRPNPSQLPAKLVILFW